MVRAITDVSSLIPFIERKLFRFQACILELPVVVADFPHVFLQVAAGYYPFRAYDALSRKIDTVELDGHGGFLGDEIKAFLPSGIDTARSFRRNGYVHVGVFAEQFGQIIRQMPVAAAVDGYASYALQQRSQRKEEPAAFHQEVRVQADAPFIEDGDDEIPVARMGRHTDYGASHLGHCLDHLPFHPSVEHFAEKFSPHRLFLI